MVSGIILLLIAGIGAGIFFAQFGFNPAIAVFQTAGIPAEQNGMEIIALISPPEGIEVLTSPEVFHPQNLYEKINGKADLYLSSGFQKLVAQRFRLKNDPNAWLEILAYEMDSGMNAFAVYSLQRRESARSSEVARFAYLTPNALFFVHGRFYVEIIAAGTGEAFSKALTASAMQFMQDRSVSETEMLELSFFPVENLVVDSVELITNAAFGFERLNYVFTAEYRVAEKSMTAFIAKRKNEAEALALAEELQKYFITYGGKPVPTSIQNAGAVDLFDSISLVFARGIYLAGVHEAEDKTAAESLARSMIQKLSEVSHDSR